MRLISQDKLIEYCEKHKCSSVPIDVIKSESPIISGDFCIVCGRDVRKDMIYYDINGATVCEGCMSVQCKVDKTIKG